MTRGEFVEMIGQIEARWGARGWEDSKMDILYRDYERIPVEAATIAWRALYESGSSCSPAKLMAACRTALQQTGYAVDVLDPLVCRHGPYAVVDAPRDAPDEVFTRLTVCVKCRVERWRRPSDVLTVSEGSGRKGVAG